jgi:hypothetical protein
MKIVMGFLLDAFEQREDAEYFWMVDGVKKYSENPRKICREIPASGDELEHQVFRSVRPQCEPRRRCREPEAWATNTSGPHGRALGV